MKALDDLQQKYPDKIDWVSDERGSRDGLWVSLKSGWQERGNPESHQIHRNTIREIQQAMRDVIPCRCTDCKH